MTKDIDYSKYKRFFAFGCSFTNTGWPTWANLLSMQMPDAKFYNFGMSGAGNQFIASRISEVNKRYKFNEDDLVIILWSTFAREDKFVGDRWQCYGSVYFTGFYDKKYLEKYFDFKGAVIRDLALIDLTKGYLNSLPCTNFDMFSVFPSSIQDVVHTDENFMSSQKIIDDYILPVYKTYLENYKNSYYDIYPWDEYIISDLGIKDSHPSPLKAYEFLIDQGFKLSTETKKYAEEETIFLKNYKERKTTVEERYRGKLNMWPEKISLFAGRYGPTPPHFEEIRP